MDTDLDTLATALYVTTDDLLRAHPERVPARPKIGIMPRTSDAEMLTLAVMQALLGYTNETQWLRYARKNLLVMFPNLPSQPGYTKRLRKLAATMSWLVGELGRQSSVATDEVWVVDSTPVECARSRETVKRSDLAGWAEYGYCASHSRFFWGLRLHLVCTLHGLPVGWALTGAKADEREVLQAILANTPGLTRPRRQVVIADKAYYGSPSRPVSTRPGSTFSANHARARSLVPAASSSNHCAKSSNQSTRPSRPNSTSSATAARLSQASAPALPKESSR